MYNRGICCSGGVQYVYTYIRRYVFIYLGGPRSAGGRATEMNGCDQLRRPTSFDEVGHPSASKIFSTKLKSPRQTASDADGQLISTA